MTNFNCGCKTNCGGVVIVAGAIIGIITAFLTFSAVITLTPAFLWVLLGIAVVYLAVLTAVSPAIGGSGARSCVCDIIPVLLTGILGTALLSVVLLGVTFAATSIAGAIFAGLLLAFFSVTIGSTACLVKCVTGCGE